ncbi:sulfatase-like hydrolase/transferase [Wenzhouxiangella sp. EGI_FJ10409]|uniref:sulfatase-like hydrolase/transferase n=1 Tax=Wenzhouxiangella sp. EGI_FJ10409 TaxID=3243767 RepID=UPI0035E3496B
MTGQGFFFLYLHYMHAHDPHLDLPRSRRTVAAMDPERLDLLTATAPASACSDRDSGICARYVQYAEATLDLRADIASLLAGLEERGVLEDTLVLLYSDHGEEFHDHQRRAEQRDQDPRGFYGFGHGQSLYQEQLHVPLIVWHPDHRGKVISTPVSLVDVLPSIADWLGIALPENVDYPGRSFGGWVHEAENGAFSWEASRREMWNDSERPLFASGIAYGPEQLAVISSGMKLIWHEADNAREFYDLTRDLLERDPVEPGRIALADRLDDLLGDYFEWFNSQDYLPPELGSDMVERLKGMGYLQGVESSSQESSQGDKRSPADRESEP